jgi:hypothetical protein
MAHRQGLEFEAVGTIHMHPMLRSFTTRTTTTRWDGVEFVRSG